MIEPASELATNPAKRRQGIEEIIESGILPSEEKQAKVIAIMQSQYTLDHVQQVGSLRAIYIPLD